MDREQKAAAISEIATQLNESSAVLAVDYRGISVPQAAELRSKLREADTSFKVVKNRLTLRAADEAGAEDLKEHLIGPTALAFVRGDVAAAAKTISKLGGDWELLAYKGGLMDGAVLPEDDFKSIAKLPGRDQLNAQFAGVVASPLTGLVRGLGSMVQGLALQLGQIAEQGLIGGDAPAEEKPEEPAAETDPDPEGSPEESSDEQAPTESDADPEPGESSEESSEEEAPAESDGGDVDTVEAAGEGDADIGEDEPAPESDEPGETDEASGDDAGDGDSDDDKEDSDGDDD